MRKHLPLIALAFLLAGCGVSAEQEKAMSGLVERFNSLAEIVEGASGRDVAAVKTDLSSWSANTRTFVNEIKDVKMTKSQEKAIEKKYKAKLEAAGERVRRAIQGLSGPNAMQIQMAVQNAIRGSGFPSAGF